MPLPICYCRKVLVFTCGRFCPAKELQRETTHSKLKSLLLQSQQFRCFLNSNTLVCLSFSTGTRLRWRLIATSSPFRKKNHTHFYDSSHGWRGWTAWTNNVVEILLRDVSWARVPEIVLQNDPALFRPKSKKMTGNFIVTFNVVTS